MILKINRRHLLYFAVLTGVFLLTFAKGIPAASAQDYNALGGGLDPFRYLRDALPSGLQPSTQGAGEDLVIAFVRNAIRIVRFILGGVALIFAILYAMQLVFARGREETITKQKQNFLWVFTGFMILLASEQIAAVFNPATSTKEAVIDFAASSDRLRDIANYLKWMFGSVAVLLMTVGGLRMIFAGGEEEKITKEKRNITWGGIGLLVILLADNIINAIYVVNEQGVAAPTPETGIQEIAGVIRLALVFLGPAAVVFTIYAGFMYLTAFENEDRANQAKRMIAGGITGIIMIYAAYALVNTFVATPLSPA